MWQAFFRDIKDEATPDGEWFKGIKTQMERLIVHRQIALAQPLDQSANEIFLNHIEDISQAFSRAGTQEAASRKLAVKTIWRAAGRASEPATLSYRTLRWNSCP